MKMLMRIAIFVHFRNAGDYPRQQLRAKSTLPAPAFPSKTAPPLLLHPCRPSGKLLNPMVQ